MLQTWLPSALQCPQLGSSTVIPKPKGNPKSSACQTSTTTELPSVHCVFYLCLHFLRGPYAQRCCWLAKVMKEGSGGTSKATPSILALESREDHLPCSSGRQGMESMDLELSAFGTHGRSGCGTERRKTSPSPPSSPPSSFPLTPIYSSLLGFSCASLSMSFSPFPFLPSCPPWCPVLSHLFLHHFVSFSLLFFLWMSLTVLSLNLAPLSLSFSRSLSIYASPALFFSSLPFHLFFFFRLS